METGAAPVPEKVNLRLILSDKPVRAVIILVFVFMIGLGIILPILPLFARSFGVDYAAAGLLISVFGFMRLIGDLVAGGFVERFGERYAGIGGLALLAVSSAAAGLAPNYPLVVALWSFGGLGSAVWFASLFSYMLKVVPAERMGRTLSFFYGSFNLGIVAGGLFGGLIADTFGLASPLFFYSGLLVASAFIYLKFVPDPQIARAPEPDETGITPAEVLVERDVAAHPQSRFENLAELFRIKGFATTLLVNLSYLWLVAAVFDTLLPLFAQDELGMSTSGIGVIFAVALATELVVLYPAGIFADRYGRKKVLLPSIAGLAVMIIIVGLAESPLSLAVLMGVLGIASGFAGVPPAAMLSDIIPKERSGRAVGVFRFCGDLGFFLGPFLAGIASEAYGFRTAFALVSIPVFLALVMVIRTPETLKREPAKA